MAVQTVYAAFGSKRELMRQLIEATITGDDDPDARHASGPELEPSPPNPTRADARSSTPL